MSKMVYPITPKHVAKDRAIKNATIGNLEVRDNSVGVNDLHYKVKTLTITAGQTMVQDVDTDLISGTLFDPIIKSDHAENFTLYTPVFNNITGALSIFIDGALAADLIIAVPVLLYKS